MSDHDRDLERAFDSQAAQFERAPVQSDPVALERLVRRAGWPGDSLILDAGCGPGLVARALLDAGHRVLGVDLSSEMIRRAVARCGQAGDRARFLRCSLHDPRLDSLAPCDGSICRYVVHHLLDPLAFIRRQVELVRSGGVVVLCDQTADPRPERAALHHALEVVRDRTHCRNLTAGAVVDLMAQAGLVDLAVEEERFWLDFDEWFDRGSPLLSKDALRELLLAVPPIRGFTPTAAESGSIRIDCIRVIARGVKP